MMRVSEKMLFNTDMRRLQRQADAVLRGQERVVSGRRVDRASDDPVLAARILRFQTTVGQVDQRLRNTNEAERFLSAGEDAFKDVEGTLHQVSELAIAMSNASKTAQDRKNGAQVLKQLFDQMRELANTTHDGQFLFAGNKVKTRPFDFDTAWQGEFVGQALPPEGVIITAATLPLDPEVLPNEVLHVTVDGINIQVILEEGVYDGESLAVEIQDKINNHPDMLNAGRSVSAAVVLDDPEEVTSPERIVITSNTVGGKSSVVFNPPGGMRIREGINDFLTVTLQGNPMDVILTPGIYKDGEALAAELEAQLTAAGLSGNVRWGTDHFVITPSGSAPFAQALPELLSAGDARGALGFLEGKSQLSKVAYQGDDGVMPVFIEPDNPLAKNFPGSVVFRGGPGGGGVDIFASLLNFKAALENNDDVGIQTAMTAMHKALEQIGEARVQIGSGLDRIEAARTVMETIKTTTVSFQSAEESIDLTEAISNLVQQQNALEAARSVAARILAAPTLLNFLQ